MRRLFASAVLVGGLLSATTARAGFDANGWIVDWLLYGPLSTDPVVGCCPTEALAGLDYLTDGVEFYESTILPDETTEVIPDFAPGTAASIGFHPTLNGENAVWMPVNTVDKGTGEAVSFDAVYGAESDNAIVYGVVYIDNPGAPIEAMVELGSDDSIQVKLDDCTVFFRSIGRGVDVAETVQDRAPVTIPTGSHRVLVKVWNGGGPSGFRLRFADAATGTPLSDSTDPGLSASLDPAEFGVPPISPVGLVVSHDCAPDRILGLDKAATVTIAATKSYPKLADGTVVTVTENLIADTAIVAGSAVPAPKSQTATSITWETTVGDLIANGIKFDFKFTKPGAGAVTGTFVVGAGGSCDSAISGKADTVAVIANAIFLGDIVGGGNGLGTKLPEVGGVRLDMDSFLATADIVPENNDSTDVDADPFQPIEATAFDPALHPELDGIDLTEAAEMIDGTFFMPTNDIQINSAGVVFSFPAGEPWGNSWNHILSNVTHDIDKGVGNIRCAGREPFATGIGVHASAGVTFDLNAIRAKYGPDKVKNFVALIGNDGCGALTDATCGNLDLFVIYSTENEVLVDETFMLPSDTDQGQDYKHPIPANAQFLTLATGDGGNSSICCDHGVWAEARIFPELPAASFTANPSSGSAPLLVNFDASASTTPPGTTLTKYSWDFGDGESGSGKTTSHTYAKRGTFTPKLTIENSDFLTDAITGAAITVSFGCGDVSSAGYTSADIGAPKTPGCARLDGDCVVVHGGGKDITAKSDQFQFVYQTKTGNDCLTASISSALFDIKTSGRAGVMFRESTAADAAFAYMHVTPTVAALKVTFTSRLTAAANAATKNTTTFLTAPNAWLRITRNGNDFTGAYSEDGVTFTDVQTVTLTAPPAQMLVGFAVTSRDSGEVGYAGDVSFCDISYCTSTPPPGGFHRGDADDNGELQLTDAIKVLGFLFLGAPAPPCMDAADADDNGDLQLTDAIRILGFLFLGGPPPSPPGPPPEACGPDPTGDDALGCDSYTHCGA